LWILVPTGVIINRLLERKIDQEKGLIHAEKLKSFFGMNEEEIRSFFYTEKQVQTLFGEEEIITKAENSIRKIAQLYVKKLKEVFPSVTDEPMVLYNNHNVPIFHLVFASKNKTAKEIAQDIINKQ
jgi:ATP-dependent Zn protease